MPEQTAVTPISQQQAVTQLLAKYKRSIEAMLPTHLRPERMMRVIVAALNRTPLLLQCDPLTIVNSVMHLSQLGLEPRPGEAYLIPFKQNRKDENGQWHSKYECVPIIDYRGKAKLARQSGLVDDIFADVVYSRDSLKYEVTDTRVFFEHRPAKFRAGSDGELEVIPDRGKMIGAYAIARLKAGGSHVVLMTRTEIEAVRDKSRAKDDGPWAMENGEAKSENDWNEMAKKTAVHRLCKLIPQSPELQMAQELEDKVDAGFELTNLIEAVNGEPETPEGATVKERVRGIAEKKRDTDVV